MFLLEGILNRHGVPQLSLDDEEQGVYLLFKG
jgi:hypothetical protein